jgi:tetratricopeptide (TPR) repeat protein
MRKILLIVLCCTAALLAGYAGYRSYKVWKQEHFMRLAREFLAKPDVRNAALCLNKVLRSNPQHLDAMRLMANLTEAGRSPSTLLWRARVVELNPHSVEDRLALARTAVMFRDISLATNTLEGVGQADRQTAAYQNLAGTVAAAANDFDSAKSHFREAIRIEPHNLASQLNLAVIQVHETNASAIAGALNTLQSISKNPTNSSLRCQALRELILNAAHNKQTNAEVALCRQLLLETNSVFNDRLVQVEVLHQTRNPEFLSSLNALQQEAASDPQKLQELATWEMTKISPAETIKWLKKLPPNTLTNQPAATLVAECGMMIGDWRGLQSFLEPQKWAELEFLRHAFKSRALREQGLTDAAKTEWEQALKSANGQKQSFVMLLRLAAQWHWVSEGEDLLWTIVSRYPQEKWATQALTQTLFAGGQTRSLMQLFKQELKGTPSDLAARNNLAMIAMLLDVKELKPHDLAREVYQQAPTNSSFAATYAFSLYLQGKSAEALKVMQQLKPKDLENPSIAGYYGLILKATGSGAKARVYLNWTSKATLLPEERKLFDQANAGS